ncbi:hypothetical protein H5410_054839 [Solanum commersonii]|uniref:Uncharacterized protein n=1 Tax=Solanum commersonii TaxID=4109 RepID=A0A9J5WG00_SOLCO|nr:hypothetical protein H5410_054839 [Solanum commersonii]
MTWRPIPEQHRGSYTEAVAWAWLVGSPPFIGASVVPWRVEARSRMATLLHHIRPRMQNRRRIRG